MDEQPQVPDGPEQAERWNETTTNSETATRKMTPNDRPDAPAQPAYTPPQPAYTPAPPPYAPRPDFPQPGYAPPGHAPQQSGYYPAYQPPRQPERRSRPGWVPWVGGCLIVFAALTFLCAAAGGIVWALEMGSDPATSTTTKTVAVTGTPDIVLHAQAANVEIVRGDANQVVVTETREVRAFTHDAAQRYLDQLKLDVQQTGNTITVTATSPEFNGFPDYFQRSVHLTIDVPQTSNLDTGVQAGNIDISDITGRLVTDVQAGNLHLANDTLASGSTIHVTAGNIDFDGALASGASMDVRVTAGNVELTLPRTTGARLQAEAHAGNVSVDGWDIPVSRQDADATATGNLGTNPTGTLTIDVTAGNITVSAA
jgi:hypothetical protein